MRELDFNDVTPLPEDAFEVSAVDVLACWLNNGLAELPSWLKSAARRLTAIEQHALDPRQHPIGWALQSARMRLKLAALEQDGVAMNGALQEDVAELDRRLRMVAKSEGDDDVRVQIGIIRQNLRPYLTAKVARRERVAWVGSGRSR